MKKYRVNSSEVTNLESMRVHLQNIMYDMWAGDIPWDKAVEAKYEEVNHLCKVARFPGDLVDWPTLARIRAIRDERNALRYAQCLNAGMDEERASYAFQ